MQRLVQQKSIQIFTKRGVPHHHLLAAHPENLGRYMTPVEIPRRGSETPILHTRDKQIRSLEGFKQVLLKPDPRTNGKLLIVAGRETDHLPGQLALALAAYTYEHQREFFWHPLMGGTRDEIRDELPGSAERLKHCAVLILSNLPANATALKVEKARDLLIHFSRLNRVVVTAGINPVEYAKTILHLKADGYSYFG